MLLSRVVPSVKRALKPIASSSPSSSTAAGICSVCAAGGAGQETAFELTSVAVRYGEGVTADVGWDAQHMGLKKVAVVTEKGLSSHPGLTTVLTSLKDHGVDAVTFDGVVVEPTKKSMIDSVDWTLRQTNLDGFIAFGGGSVMDTAKVMNLYLSYPTDDFMTYVNAPVGMGTPVPGPVKPLIALPTTAGTGSETTGVRNTSTLTTGLDENDVETGDGGRG